MSEQAPQDSQQESEAASSPAEQNAPVAISEAMAAGSEPPSATTQSEQPAPGAEGAPNASGASEGASTATEASTNSTTADLSNLAQTVPSGGAKSPADKSAVSAASSRSHRSPASGTRSTTGGHSERAESKSPSTPKASGQGKRKRMKLGELDLSTAKIGFLGAGKMAESTINGLIHYGEYLINTIEFYFPFPCQLVDS